MLKLKPGVSQLFYSASIWIFLRLVIGYFRPRTPRIRPGGYSWNA